MADGIKSVLAESTQAGGADKGRAVGAADASPGQFPDLFGEAAEGAQGAATGQNGGDVTKSHPPAGPGRPPGARNRSTERWREYLHGRYGSPLERALRAAMSPAEMIMAEMIGADRLAELQKRAGMSLTEASAACSAEKPRDAWRFIEGAKSELATLRRAALERQDKLGDACLPYLHQKQPTAVELPAGTSFAFATVINGQVQGDQEALIEGEFEEVPDGDDASEEFE